LVQYRNGAQERRFGRDPRSDSHVVSIEGSGPSVYRMLFILLVAAALSALALASVGAAQGSAATLLKGSFDGHGYGTFANAKAGPVATELGRSAFVPLGCAGTGGETRSNVIDSLEAGDDGRVLRADEVVATAFSDRTSSSAVAKTTSTVSGLNAFDGLITADAVKAVATTSADASKIRTTSRGSKFVNLTIAGEAIDADVATNTRVDLPGIGYVLLKSVNKGGNGTSIGKITVDMITVVVTEDNDYALPVGARIVVAEADSGFRRLEPADELGGQAYAATAASTIDEVENRVGRAAFIAVGCQGTQGKVRSNNVNLLNVEGVLSSGTGRTTAYGESLSTGSVVRTTATVEDVDLLGGLIRADLVKAVAENTRSKSGQTTSSADGSRFVNLTIAGESIDANVPPNTRIDLPGVGYVIVNEQRLLQPTATREQASALVRALHVVVDTGDTLGLPVGTELIVAHAKTTIEPFDR
jgi:hypothetical protein